MAIALRMLGEVERRLGDSGEAATMAYVARAVAESE
jgi:hypothetical protein